MPHMINVSRFVLLVASVAVFPPGHAAEPRVTGIFSNLQFGTEDLAGVEMYIVPSRGNYYATVVCAEGGPGVPETVKLTVSGSSISFVVPANSASNCPAGAVFTGQISVNGINGAFSGSELRLFLNRGKGYWQ